MHSETTTHLYSTAVVTVLVEDCDVRGVTDGVYFNTNFVHLLNCHIHGAQRRGIFGLNHFVITVRGCGGYDMKTRGSCERRDRNNIQEGPWDMLIPVKNSRLAAMFPKMLHPSL
jgi:hypothetical protein